MTDREHGEEADSHGSRAGRRGAYAKGVAKREEILTRALDVVATNGAEGASVREIAKAVGLSQAGLLHYFASKEELFTEILRKRDEVDSAGLRQAGEDAGEAGALSFDAVRDGFVDIVRHNARVPGLVELYSRMAVDAADPDSVAHGYFSARDERLSELFTGAIRDAQATGRVDDRVPPEILARMVKAVADGMQVQWLLDPSIDMARVIEAFFTLLAPRE